MMTEEVRQQKAWVTGATSGIGLALTKALSRQGYQVFISARNETALVNVTADIPNTVPILFDVTQEQHLASVKQNLLDHTRTLDKVFVNAGNCEYLEIDTPDWSMIKRINETNLVGAANTVAVALPLLQAQAQHYQAQTQDQKQAWWKKTSNRKGQPQIIGISSLATVVPFPKAEAYGASKAGLNYFLKSLRIDLRAQHISVTTVLPGFVKTPLTDKNTFSMPFIMDADKTAENIIRGIASHPREFVLPKRLYWILRICQCFPSYWEKIMSPNDSTTSSLIKGGQ